MASSKSSSQSNKPKVYDIFKPWETLDPWQEEYIAAIDKNCFLLCGRQSGKSAAMSIKFGEIAVNQPMGEKEVIMMVAFTEKQAYALFFKTLMYLEAKHPTKIKRGNDKPTKHEINLTNGSKIMCYAAGKTGDGLRTFTLTRLAIDEAAPMAREIFTATTPMLSVTGGFMDIASTPRGKEGYFYECSDDPALGNKVRKDFKRFYISAEDCPRHTKEFLESEKATMSELQYAQEYLAKFLSDIRRVFKEGWIKKVCVLKRSESTKGKNNYLGVDIARMGEDDSAFEVLNKISNESIQQTESITTSKTKTTETEDKILELERTWGLKGIFIDAGAGSLGVGVLDHLLTVDKTKRKTFAVNNRTQVLDRDGNKTQRLLNEDLYNNMIRLGERGILKLFNDDDVIESLTSVQWEFNIKPGATSKIRYFGRKTHIAEALIRACCCSAERIKKFWVYT